MDQKSTVFENRPADVLKSDVKRHCRLYTRGPVLKRFFKNQAVVRLAEVADYSSSPKNGSLVLLGSYVNFAL